MCNIGNLFLSEDSMKGVGQCINTICHEASVLFVVNTTRKFMY